MEEEYTEEPSNILDDANDYVSIDVDEEQVNLGKNQPNES